MSKNNKYEQEENIKIGIVEFLSYSIAVLVFIGIGIILTNLIVLIIGKPLPTLKTQVIYSSCAYLICFIVNLPIMFTLGKKY